MIKVKGYLRENGKYGIRNHLAIIPTSVCASQTAIRIAALVPGAVALPHQHGCCQVGVDHRQTMHTLAGLGKNPNVGAVLVVGLGCDGIQADGLAEMISESGKPVEYITIQECHGTLRAIETGARIARKMMQQLSQQEQVEFDIKELVLALECGGSDPTSGIASNPSVGAAAQLLMDEGGSCILSETTEMIGAEHILAERCVTPEVSEKLLHIVNEVEKRAISMGEDLRGSQPTPGNIAGGLTTIEDKSLGCMYKAGHAPIQDVVGYGDAVPTGAPGLYIMDTPGQDIESITGMVAGGAQIVVFTTGRGSPTGCPLAPVIKVSGNSHTYEIMEDNIDINAGKIITEGYTVDQLGHEIFDEVVQVARGKMSKAESLGHQEFAIYRVGYTF